MKKTKIYFLLFLLPVWFWTDNVFGMVSKLDVDNIAKWGAAAPVGRDTRAQGRWVGDIAWPCKSYDPTDEGPIFIGKTKGPSPDLKSKNSADEYGIMLMVARETSEGGARFCPMAINAENRNKGKKTWTYYHGLSGNCVWLCHEGFTGEQCNLRTENVKNCDSTMLKRSDYDNLTLPSRKDVPNIEDFVPNFLANHHENCKAQDGQGFKTDTETDWILIISDWLNSGHGAYVQVHEIRARWKNGDVTQVEATHSVGSKPVLGCKNGYKPNSAGTDCVPIKDDLCGISSPSTSQNTSTSETGTESSATKYYRLSKDRLLYGAGSSETEINQQCWIKDDQADYKRCVLGGAIAE